MHYSDQDDYPVVRRRRFSGPFAVFGRGRLLSFAMMAGVAVFSFLSNNTSWVRPRTNTAGSFPQPTLQQAGQQLQTSRVQQQRQQQILNSNPVEVHGGIVEDQRTQFVRQVGARLVQSVEGLQPNAIRFFLLRDTKHTGSYALMDGSVLITAGTYSQIQSESQLAQILSQQMTKIIHRGVDPLRHPEIANFPTRLLIAAGYQSAAPTQVIPVAAHAQNPAQTASPISSGWGQY